MSKPPASCLVEENLPTDPINYILGYLGIDAEQYATLDADQLATLNSILAALSGIQFDDPDYLSRASNISCITINDKYINLLICAILIGNYKNVEFLIKNTNIDCEFRPGTDRQTSIIRFIREHGPEDGKTDILDFVWNHNFHRRRY